MIYQARHQDISRAQGTELNLALRPSYGPSPGAFSLGPDLIARGVRTNFLLLSPGDCLYCPALGEKVIVRVLTISSATLMTVEVFSNLSPYSTVPFTVSQTGIRFFKLFKEVTNVSGTGVKAYVQTPTTPIE
jgi:hypothetical protein